MVIYTYYYFYNRYFYVIFYSNTIYTVQKPIFHTMFQWSIIFLRIFLHLFFLCAVFLSTCSFCFSHSMLIFPFFTVWLTEYYVFFSTCFLKRKIFHLFVIEKHIFTNCFSLNLQILSKYVFFYTKYIWKRIFDLCVTCFSPLINLYHSSYYSKYWIKIVYNLTYFSPLINVTFFYIFKLISPLLSFEKALFSVFSLNLNK